MLSQPQRPVSRQHQGAPSAGGAALQVERSIQDGLLTLHHVAGLQLGDEVVGADALNEHAEALAGLTLLPVEEQGALYHLNDLLLGVDLIHHGANALALPPQAAHKDAVAHLLLCHTVEPAGLHALAAVVADLLVDLHDAVLVQVGGLHRTHLHHGALGAAVAVVGVIGGHPLPQVKLDCELAAYLLRPTASDYTTDRLAAEYAVVPLPCESEDPLAQEMAKLIPLAAALEAKIAQQEQQWLLTEVEQPLAEVLASMELIGFSLDTEGLTAYGQELDTQPTARAEEIYELAGGQFNINSPMQLGNVLFEKLGLPHGKKTQRGYSTNADVLESLRDKHPIIDCILDYRKLAKLKNTYVDGLIKVVGEDGRVHSIFKQTETRTGRISSAEPNLQNIPVRTDVGSVFRKFFYAAGDRTLVDADYSQIELRVLAHIAQDVNMIEGFRSGADIHTQTAAQVFGMPPEYVTSQMRSRAKAVNFGIVYGIGAYSLSKDIGVTVAEANAYINGYLRTYHGVRQYMEDTKQFAKDHGYVKTLFGRRRDLPEMSATNRITRAFGERVAMNTPIQGTAADIIKIAMVRVYRRLQAEGLKSRLILQVHDELIVETTPDEIDTVKALVQQEMSGAAELSVPLVVDVGVGKTWYEAK